MRLVVDMDVCAATQPPRSRHVAATQPPRSRHAAATLRQKPSGLPPRPNALPTNPLPLPRRSNTLCWAISLGVAGFRQPFRAQLLGYRNRLPLVRFIADRYGRTHKLCLPSPVVQNVPREGAK